MNAPKRIYIPAESAKLYKNDGLLYKGVEYVRMDVVLDLLKGFDNPITKLAYREVVDKLNQL